MLLFEKKKINLKCPNLSNLLLPFLNLEVDFSWPSWTSKYVISSLNTLQLQSCSFWHSQSIIQCHRWAGFTKVHKKVMNSAFVHFLEDGTKLKILSEIAGSLAFQFTLSQSGGRLCYPHVHHNSTSEKSAMPLIC